MSLVKAKEPEKKEWITYHNRIAALIQQRRLQILVHSYLYYHRNTNIISDQKWQEFAQQLVTLQKQHPEVAKQVIYAEAFADFDASTGFHLPYMDERIMSKGEHLLRLHQQEGGLL